jgi:hypothetical protein
MVELAINDGFIDCPKLGIMDEWRCLASCEHQTAKDENKVTCCFGEEQAPEPADAKAKPAERKA